MNTWPQGSNGRRGRDVDFGESLGAGEHRLPPSLSLGGKGFLSVLPAFKFPGIKNTGAAADMKATPPPHCPSPSQQAGPLIKDREGGRGSRLHGCWVCCATLAAAAGGRAREAEERNENPRLRSLGRKEEEGRMPSW